MTVPVHHPPEECQPQKLPDKLLTQMAIANFIKICGMSLFSTLFLLIAVPSAFALTTVTKTPTTCTNTTGIGTRSWSTTSYAISSDDQYANVSLDGNTSNYLKCQGYGFAIPATATINGITVNVERKSSRTTFGGSQDAAMRLAKGGIIGSTDNATTTTYTKRDVTEAHGSGSDLWGLSWTPADINATTFGAAFAATKASNQASSHKISVDVITITVSYTPDTTPPVVSSLTLANANPSANTTVSWTVVFSESVTGVDAADFALVQAGGVSGAIITSVAGSGATWTVTANSGNGSGTLGLNLVDNDSILDLAGNKLGGTGAGNGNFTGQVYTMDKINPRVNFITLASANPTNAASVSWTVTFSESVTGVDAADFSLVQSGGVSGASISAVIGSGTTRTVTANTGSGSGTLGLNLVDNDTIIDTSGRPLGGVGTGNGNFSGQVYTIDKTNPAVSAINRTDMNPTDASLLSWTVIFNKNVTGVDLSDFVLVASGLSGSYLSALTAESDGTWTVTANTGIGSGSLGLNLADNDSIIGAFAIPLGGPGANNGNFTGQVYTITATPPLAIYSMDEISWNGTLDEVTDSEDSFPGTAKNSATTTDGTPALAGNLGTCRYGVFDNGGTITKGYIELPDFPDLDSDFTITAWIRTTNNTLSGQRILIDDETKTHGFSFSLGDGGAGKLRFLSRGITPSVLDSTYVIASNTWYFVAAVADITNKKRTIYVFNAAGSLLNTTTESAWTGGVWGTDDGMASIGGETSSSVTPPTSTSYHFKGNLDEVSMYDKVLTQAAVTSLARLTHACSAAALVDHYELSVPTGSVSCEATTNISVTACSDSSSPCTNKYVGGTGQTATLTASGGALTPIPVIFDATGVASATLSYPAAADGAVVSVTLAGEQITAINPRKCCPDGANCVVANSCATTFKTAGFIFTALANGAAATIPNQVAGTSSSTYYLRAIKTNTITKVCEAALAGLNSVELAYECKDPASCYAANLMSMNGGTATTIARNNNGAVSSYTPVNMTFDANGNAPFSLNYGDAGQVKLHARKTASGSLLSPLTGSSNAFAVKPYDFGVIPCAAAVVGACTTAPADPGLVGGGSAFAKSGESFKATVTARTATNTATPSFGLGSNNSTETVNLTHTRLAPIGAGTAGGTLGGTTAITRTIFNNGVATINDLSWSEAGVISLTATNSAFLGNALTTTGTSGNIGRFIPDHFSITPGALTEGCDAGNFTYFGQDGFATPFTLTAQNAAGGTTQNYTGAFAKFDPTLWSSYNFTATWLPAAPNPISTLLASATSPTGNWSNGIASVTAIHQASRPVSPVAAANITVSAKPTDTDGVTIATPTPVQTAATPLRYGRLVLKNAYGTEREALKMRLQTQYYNGSAFVTNAEDTCVSYSAAALACTDANVSDTLACADVTVSGANLGNGQFFTLSAPNKTGPLLYTLTVPAWLKYEWDNADSDYNENPFARANFGIYRGNDRILNWREIIR